MGNYFGKLVFGSLVLTAACGGTTVDTDMGSTTPPTSYLGIFDTTSSEMSVLGAHSIDSTVLALSGSTGTFDRSTNQATISGLSGTVNATRTSVALNGGGTISINNSGTTYVANYTAQPTGSNPTTGVVGIATHPTHIPSGSASYVGSSTLQIIDGTSVFDLTGASAASVNFGSRSVSVTYSGLSGTRTDGVSAPVGVSNVGTLLISGSTISGNTFSGGVASLTSSQVASSLSGGQTVATSGGFFGPGALEIGGVNLINDTAGAGSLLLLGTFVGQ